MLDRTLGRHVAIKVLPPSVRSDRGRLRRMKREVAPLAALNHPNVATIHGLETFGEDLLLVMELVDG